MLPFFQYSSGKSIHNAYSVCNKRLNLAHLLLDQNCYMHLIKWVEWFSCLFLFSISWYPCCPSNNIPLRYFCIVIYVESLFHEATFATHIKKVSPQYNTLCIFLLYNILINSLFPKKLSYSKYIHLMSNCNVMYQI